MPAALKHVPSGLNDSPPRGSKVQVAPAVEDVTPPRHTLDRDAHSASSSASSDSGFDDHDNIITETTQNGEVLASQDMPASVGTDFLVTGSGFGSRSNKQRNADSAKSTQSNYSTVSAPSILERPKSRGGCAFDITYEDSRAPRPARLKSLESQKSGSELTLEQLEKKLRAAERRRLEYENKVKAKMHQESAKLELGKRMLTRERTSLDKSMVKSENKATENRQKHLETLRAKLKAKEVKAKKVRANRELRRQEQEEALKNNRPTTAQAITA